tara:strand:- start:561 stop:671 length:111 start_codon:yes stop_codon:yes gene_type:complete
MGVLGHYNLNANSPFFGRGFFIDETPSMDVEDLPEL